MRFAPAWTPPTGSMAARPSATKGPRVKRNRQLPEQSPVGRELGRTILGALATQPAFLLGRPALALRAAAVQSLRGRRALRPARRRLGALGAGQRRAVAHRPVLHAVPVRSGGLRRRRTRSGRHLWHARGQAAGRRPDPVSVEQPAPGAPGDAGRARLLVLLAAEHGARRPAARPCCSSSTRRSRSCAAASATARKPSR